MAEKRIQSVARVTVVLEIKVDSVWGPDCTVEQVYKQAADSAKLLLAQKFNSHTNVSIVEKPKVTAVLIPEK